jgi:hypothetical protein
MLLKAVKIGFPMPSEMPRIVEILRSEGTKSFPDKGMGVPKYKRQVKWIS